MRWWMLTGPVQGFKRKLKLFTQNYDIHRWFYCIEIGDTGYRHVHLKLLCNENIQETEIRIFWHPMHVEISNESENYLRKPGAVFVSSRDTQEIRRVRFGSCRPWQEVLLCVARQQDVREVLVLLDELGGIGKSWLANYLFETGLGFFVPPTLSTPKDLIQFIHSGYVDQEFIIIDIPRSWKWSEHLYSVIETIKDGLVYDSRYKAQMRNIRGVSIIVFTNNNPKLSKLSTDRWHIVKRDGGGLFSVTLEAPLSLDKGGKVIADW